MAHSLSCPSCGDNLHNINRSLEFVLHGPRYHELLASNAIPSATELATLSTVVANGSDLIADLETKISQERAQEMVKECKTIVHPVRRLPRDILLEIFATASITDDDSVWETSFPHSANRKPLDSLTTRKALWGMQSMAKRGYHVFTTMSSISVSFLHEYFDRRKLLSRLSIQLQRAANSQLEVAILLLPSSSRWTRLHFRAGFTDFISQLQGFLPLLRVLYLSIDQTNPCPHQSFDVFREAPQLRTLNVKEWRLLKRGENGSRPSQILQLMERAMALESCEVISRAVGRAGTHPLTMDKLKVASFDGDGTAQVLEFLRLPVIEDLTIMSGLDNVEVLVGVLEQSGGGRSLKSLRLDSRHLKASQALEMLRSMPCLESLDLRTDEGFTDTFLGSFSEETMVVVLCHS
ncbi:hypothetical protein C8J56DRAFT_886754 [Mycena floridula]|nr:hypothetical protein C8J56DRAFT_886754 [Mycena floridula]